MSEQAGDGFVTYLLEQAGEGLMSKDAQKEAVDHPAHYGGDTVYETIKVLEAWLTYDEYVGFLKGNVIKYLSRAGKKGSAKIDTEKASWYQAELDRFMSERAGG